MKTIHGKANGGVRKILFAAVLAALGGCASQPVDNPAADAVAADWRELQANPNLATQAPLAMQEAQQAVASAQLPERDQSLSAHRVYLAERKVATARASAQAEYAETQRDTLSKQSSAIQLDARTREADAARLDADVARTDASKARADADDAQLVADEALQQASNANADADMARDDTYLAQEQANAALSDAAAANRRSDGLLLALADLQAKKTARGIQLTLGDVLFSSGRAELKAGSAANLDRLAAALQNTPDRQIDIAGYTDSQGDDAMNMALSQRRADTVSDYLVSHGVASQRISAIGKGEAFPVAGNEIPAGRQLNRRVEVTVVDPAL